MGLSLAVSTVNAAAIPLTYDGKTINYTGKQLKILCNSQEINLAKTPAILDAGYAMMPYKAVLEDTRLGVKTAYSAKTQTITLKKDKQTVVLKVGSKAVTINGVSKTMGIAPKIVSYDKYKMKKVLVPARFVAESLGLSYQYTSATGTVNLSAKDSSSNQPVAAGRMIEYGGKQVEYKQKEITVSVEGKKVKSNMPGLLLNGVSLLPANMTFAGSGIGAKYQYTPSKKQVVIYNEVHKIEYTLGSQYAYVDKKKTKLSEPAWLVKDIATNKNYVMVPGYFTATNLGYEYEWNNNMVMSSIKTPEDGIIDPGEDNEQTTTATTSSTSKPGGSTSKPNASTSKPDATTSKPNASTSKPNTSTSKPEATTAKPSTGTTANEGGSTTKPPGTTGSSSVRITKPKGITVGTYKTSDNYWLREFRIILPGDCLDAISSLVTYDKNVIKDISYNLNDDDNTEVILKTSVVKAFVIKESKNYIDISIKSPKEVYDKIVIVDAGHGGSDPGATYNDVKEKDATLSIAQYINESFAKDTSIKIYYTRLEDAVIGMTAGSSGVPNANASLPVRYNFANEIEGDMYISIHVNASTNTTASGTETYYSLSNPYTNSGGLNSKTLATIAHPYLLKAIGSRDRGVKTANFAVIRYSKMPSILIETAFSSNKSDSEILKNQEKLRDIAQAVYDTVQSAFTKYPVKR